MQTMNSRTQTQIDAQNTRLASVKGIKITMLIENTVGAVVLRHVTLSESTEAIADGTFGDKVATRLFYAMKGCRKAKGFKITADTKLVLAEGWQTVDGMTEDKRGQFSYDDWSCFDESAYVAALEQLEGVKYWQGI